MPSLLGAESANVCTTSRGVGRHRASPKAHFKDKKLKRLLVNFCIQDLDEKHKSFCLTGEYFYFFGLRKFLPYRKDLSCTSELRIDSND